MRRVKGFRNVVLFLMALVVGRATALPARTSDVSAPDNMHCLAEFSRIAVGPVHAARNRRGRLRRTGRGLLGLAGLMATMSIGALLLTLSGSVVASARPELTGPYLGQALPGRTPRLFAPGIVSVSANFEHSAAVFSPDGRELFWCTNVGMRSDPPGEGQRLYYMRQVDGVWTAPGIAPFMDGITVPVERPVLSLDGSRLYVEFSSNPIAEDDSDIYLVERQEDSWSAPVSVSPRINTRATERLLCVTSDGSLVFSRDPFTNREKIYISRRVDGAFAEPEELGEPFDSAGSELAIVIAPDESYLLVAVTQGGAHRRALRQLQAA